MLYIYLLTCTVSVLSNHPLPISTFLADILISDSFFQQTGCSDRKSLCNIWGLLLCTLLESRALNCHHTVGELHA